MEKNKKNSHDKLEFYCYKDADGAWQAHQQLARRSDRWR